MNNDRIWILLTRKLSEEATATELQELNLLLEQQPDAQKMVNDVSSIWRMNTGADNEFLEATYLQHLERMKVRGFNLNSEEPAIVEEAVVYIESVPKLFSLKRIMVAASVILALGCFVVFLPAIKKSSIEQKTPALVSEILTPNGSRTKILLPDGSNVWLNSGSKLKYDKNFETGFREVYLTGEAFFDVVKNPKRPFIIHTAKIDVKVLGTRFNVKAYENDKTVETSLIRGSVEVFLRKNPANKYLLKPNQKLVLQNDDIIEKEQTVKKYFLPDTHPIVEIKQLSYLKGTRTDIESSWTKNILSFEDETFTDVAKKMERWYDIEFEFKNKKWEDKFLSGSFEKESLEQAMKALQFSTGFKFKIEDKTVHIY